MVLLYGDLGIRHPLKPLVLHGVAVSFFQVFRAVIALWSETYYLPPQIRGIYSFLMSGSDNNSEHYKTLVRLVEGQRDETRELRKSITDMNRSIGEFASLLTRLETLHQGHDDSMKRFRSDMDDHEERIRLLERTQLKNNSYAAGSWKAISLISTIVSFVIGIAVSIAVRLIK